MLVKAKQRQEQENIKDSVIFFFFLFPYNSALSDDLGVGGNKLHIAERRKEGSGIPSQKYPPPPK